MSAICTDVGRQSLTFTILSTIISLFGDTARDLHTFVMRLHIFEAILPRVYYFPAFVTVISLTFDYY